MSLRMLIVRLKNDEAGAILSAELVIVLTVVVIGLITGLACLQQAIVGELQDVSAAFTGLNQSYFTPSFRGCVKSWGRTSGTAGSMFVDRRASQWGFGISEIGIGQGTGGVTYAAPQTTVLPQERCTTCPPATTACPPGTDCPPVSTEVPCPTCPPGQPTIIPQGPAPQLSPQSW
jgi:hypothetical protein